MTTTLHASIADLTMPDRVAALPRDQRGYPVPRFVAWLDVDGRPLERGQGTPEFRVIHPGAITEAINGPRCWICGGRLGRRMTFVIGPMCAVNRNSAEPPSHHDCAGYAARACPFLARPHARRRENNLPTAAGEAAGIMLRRNPGVTLLWTTRRYRPWRDPAGGVLFEIGEPERVEWLAEGRAATRAEVLASIDSGLPALRELAEQEGPLAERELDRCVDRAMAVVPA